MYRLTLEACKNASCNAGYFIFRVQSVNLILTKIFYFNSGRNLIYHPASTKFFNYIMFNGLFEHIFYLIIYNTFQFLFSIHCVYY